VSGKRIARNRDFAIHRESFHGESYLRIDLKNIINIKLEYQEASVPQVNLLLKEEILRKLALAYLESVSDMPKLPKKQ